MSCTNHFISAKEKRSFSTSEFLSTTSPAQEQTLNLVGVLTPSGQGEMLDTVVLPLFYFFFLLLTSKKTKGGGFARGDANFALCCV